MFEGGDGSRSDREFFGILFTHLKLQNVCKPNIIQ